MKKLIYEIDKKFRVWKHRAVPHITIVAPFGTNNQKRLVHDFKSVCSQYSIMNFKVNGYGCFKNSGVVYVNIEPSEKLKEFKKELLKIFSSYCKLNTTDISYFLGIFKFYKKWSPHATLAMKLKEDKFIKIKNYIERKKEPNYKHCLIRVALIKNNRILYEYDFLLKKLLTRREAKSKIILAKTMRILKQKV